MQNTENQNKIQVTPYEAATHLLTNPKARMSGTQRRAARQLRDITSTLRAAEAEGVAEPAVDGTRASRRRLAKALKKPLTPRSQPRKSREAALVAKLRTKNAVQLTLIHTRGILRGNISEERAAKAKAPKVRAAYTQAAQIFRVTAEMAKVELTSRQTPQSVCE